MAHQVIKILLIGPVKSGKSSLANFLTDAKENPYGDYRPTVGCRILETQLEQETTKNRKGCEIQIWDCSGDHKFQNSWPALAHETQAVILVYDAAREDHIKELEELCSVWTSHLLDLPSARYLIAARQLGSGPTTSNPAARSGSLSSYRHVDWNIDSQAFKVQSDFKAFAISVAADAQRKQEEQEITIMKE